MPEFEETSSTSNPSHSYTPSTDAKPRTRRRSGGFKKEYGNAPKGNMGEVDPVDALKSEKLSGGSDAPATEAPKQERKPKAEKAEKPERKERKPRQKREPREDDTPRGNPEPSEATLASIQVVESRIAERKAERDARYEERKKARAAEKKDKPAAKASNQPKAGAKKQPAKKKGLLASILSLFGLGPKEPAKKSGNNKGGRPQDKGGNRGGQNRRGGKGGNRGGQGRRGGRGGQNRRRRPQGARSE